jgi:hypothetical protein
MKAIGSILSALLLTSTVAVVPTLWTTEVRAQVSVGKIAPEVTVWIRGVDDAQNFGSGVIVARSGKTYTVLTAFHVVDSPDQYTIKAPDGIDYPLKNIQRFQNADMATVQFDSSSSYTLAKLGNSDATELASSAYVAGYPKAGLNVDAVFTLTKGEISAIIPKNQAKDGYAIAYSTLTRSGMSGGPVFNDAGEVIAIHGRKESERSGASIADGSWVNLGIPISRYKAGGSGGGATVDYRAAAEAQRKAESQRAAQAAQAQQQAEAQRKAEAQRAAQAEAQRKAEAQRLAQAEAQRKAEAQRLAQAEAQRKAEAQRLAQAEAQRKAEAQRLADAQKQAEARKQAEAQRVAQAAQAQQQAEAQQKAEAQRLADAQKQAEARRSAQAAQQQQVETQQKAQASRSKLMALANMQPLAAPIAAIKPAAIAPPKKVCEKIRINTIVTERCTTVSGTPEPGVTLESGRNQTSKDSPEYYIASGNQSTTSGRLDSAIADYSKAIQRDSSSGIAYFNRGLAYLKKGQSSDATSDFTKAAELFRSSGDSSNLRKTEEILGELGRA